MWIFHSNCEKKTIRLFHADELVDKDEAKFFGLHLIRQNQQSNVVIVCSEIFG